MKRKIVDLYATACGASKAVLVCGLLAVPLMAGADEGFALAAAPVGGARVTGKVTVTMGTSLQLELRDGRSITVDLNAAQKNHLIGPVAVGEFLVVQGSLSGALMTAVAAYRAKSNPDAWMPDIS